MASRSSHRSHRDTALQERAPPRHAPPTELSRGGEAVRKDKLGEEAEEGAEELRGAPVRETEREEDDVTSPPPLTKPPTRPVSRPFTAQCPPPPPATYPTPLQDTIGSRASQLLTGSSEPPKLGSDTGLRPRSKVFEIRSADSLKASQLPPAPSVPKDATPMHPPKPPMVPPPGKRAAEIARPVSTSSSLYVEEPVQWGNVEILGEFTRSIFGPDMTSGEIVRALKDYFRKLASLRSSAQLESGPAEEVTPDSEWLMNHRDLIKITEGECRCSEELFTRAAKHFGVKPSAGEWSIDFGLWIDAEIPDYPMVGDEGASTVDQIDTRYTPTEREITERLETILSFEEIPNLTLQSLMEVYEQNAALFDPRPQEVKSVPQNAERLRKGNITCFRESRGLQREPTVAAKHEKLRCRIDELLEDLESKCLATATQEKREKTGLEMKRKRRRKKARRVKDKYMINDMINHEEGATDLQTVTPGIFGRPSGENRRSSRDQPRASAAFLHRTRKLPEIELASCYDHTGNFE
ncbi:hypothetical protein FOZ63_015966, partial [Perkinsus olseni]